MAVAMPVVMVMPSMIVVVIMILILMNVFLVVMGMRLPAACGLRFRMIVLAANMHINTPALICSPNLALNTAEKMAAPDEGGGLDS